MATTAITLPQVNALGFYEIRMESIGGFGANLAGKILGEAGVLYMGLNGSNFSSYGSEKKGSPVKAFVRFCAADVKVRDNAPVTEPHILAIFTEAMVKSVPVMQGVNKDTVVILNTNKTPDEARKVLKMSEGTLVCIDAMRIAVEEKTRVNTAMLGAIAAHSGFIDPEAIKRAIDSSLGKKYAFLVPANLKTFDRGFAEGVSKTFSDDGSFPAQPFVRTGQKIGYKNQPIGGSLPNFASTLDKDLSSSRMGWVPVLHRDACTSCGECDITCPDYCFEWVRKPDKKGKEQQFLERIVYQYCKGCLRCVDICKFDALKGAKEYEVDEEIMTKGFTEGEK